MAQRPYGLSDRQVEILKLLADGYTTSQICRKLFIEPNTVKTHLYRVGKQMGCGERSGMVALAYRCGVLRIPDDELLRQADEVNERIREQRLAAMRADLIRQGVGTVA